MTTLDALIQQSPVATHGHATPISYGIGEWRFAFEVADPLQGSNVVWHDLTSPVAELTWRRGSSVVRGRCQPMRGTVRVQARDDRYAPWNTDNSAHFGGTHVPLQAGLLVRAGLFRVDGGVVDLHFPLFTARVWRWHDQTAALGQIRTHRVECVDLLTTMHGQWVAPRPAEGWKDRFDAVLDAGAGWDFGADVYAAEKSDGVSTLVLAERGEQQSASVELDATLDPAGLTWRTRPNGRLVAHPWPWDIFHAGWFAGATTITGTEWTNPIDTYYPAGVVFDFQPTADDVAYVQEGNGGSAGIGSDYEEIANQMTVRHPIDANDVSRGFAVSSYDDVTSASKYGRRDAQGATWQAQNDAVLRALVKSRAFAHFVAEPIQTDINKTGAFPAMAVLDHLDPVTVTHKTTDSGPSVSQSGIVRWVDHTMRPLRDDTNYDGALDWTMTTQVDMDATEVAGSLESPTALASTSISATQASFSWVDPGGHAATPTNTQVRIFGSQSQWIPIGYPVTAHTWSDLRPSTWYEFEVRYVTRVDSIVTHYSEPTRLAFFTDEQPRTELRAGGTLAVVPPDAIDPDPGCTTYWKVEKSFNQMDWLLVSSGDETSFTMDGGDTVLDLVSVTYEDGVWYRIGTRNICDDRVGLWHYTLPYQRNGASRETLQAVLFNTDEAIANGVNLTAIFILDWDCEILRHTLTANNGGTATVDVNRNGSSIMSSPVAVSGGGSSSAGVFSSTSLNENDVITFDVTGAAGNGAVTISLLVERQVGV